MRKLLLDTHAFLWWLGNDSRLGPKAREAISDERNDVFVSAVTGWEIAIKRSIGKLSAPDNLDALLEDEGFSPLAITFYHGEQAGSLPPHHKDPFDRMLVAQAQAEGLTLVTRDKQFTLYGVRVLPADS
ncbi:MAG: type II toxin-antitoxin system VapC family toxin [Pseudomonadota bacterium]|nr:type II toxin-antitoxin system VapC family toxin [Pseudomonadota bacterium]